MVTRPDSQGQPMTTDASANRTTEGSRGHPPDAGRDRPSPEGPPPACSRPERTWAVCNGSSGVSPLASRDKYASTGAGSDPGNFPPVPQPPQTLYNVRLGQRAGCAAFAPGADPRDQEP